MKLSRMVGLAPFVVVVSLEPLFYIWILGITTVGRNLLVSKLAQVWLIWLVRPLSVFGAPLHQIITPTMRSFFDNLNIVISPPFLYLFQQNLTNTLPQPHRSRFWGKRTNRMDRKKDRCEFSSTFMVQRVFGGTWKSTIHHCSTHYATTVLTTQVHRYDTNYNTTTTVSATLHILQG